MKPAPAIAFANIVSFLPLLAAVAQAQSPNLQPAQLLPGSPVVGPAAGNQRSPATARGSGSSLLVFEDARAGDSDLFGLRLDASGAPLETIPFPITKDPGNQTTPKVVWNGESWLVVYANQVDPGSGYFANQFAALRVSPEGQVLDSSPIVISEDDTGGNFGVASDGKNWAVLYTGYSGGNNGVVAKRISASGAILDPGGVVVFPASYYIVFGLTATFSANEYLFSWIDNGTQARRFDTRLLPLDPAPILLPYGGVNNDGGNSIAADGSEFFIAWARETPQYQFEVIGTRLDANLNAINATPIAISGTSPSVSFISPLVVWDGMQWIVSWTTAATSFEKAARISAGGICLEPGGVLLPDNAPSNLYTPTLGALPSGGALYAWSDYRYLSTDVFGTPFTASGQTGSERCYSLGAEALRSPRVTPGSNQQLVTCRAELANAARILAQRVDRFGNALDLEPIVVASSSSTNLYAGGAAWNGSVYLVTWTDTAQGKIFARRLLPDGSWLDLAPIFVLLGGGADAAALGQDFLVTGLRAPSYPQYIFSYGARVRGSDGLVLDNPALSIGPSYATRARVVTLGGRWLVATESHWSHDENPANLMLSFVDANGAVTPGVNAGMLNIQNWGIIDIASSGTSAIVLGQSGSNWTNADVYARRILPDGSMPAPMFNATGSVGLGQSKPAIVWTGSEYVIGYESYQNNVWFYDYEPDLYGVRVSEGGTMIDAGGFALWNGEDYEVSVEAGSLGGGKALYASSTYVDGDYGSFRISLRGMRPDGLSNYGIGTPGCDGPQQMDANGEPFFGNGAFVLQCTRAPAGGLGVLVLSTAADLAGSDPLGLGVLSHVGLLPPAFFLLYALPVDPAGLAVKALPIPADAALVGTNVYFQAAFDWSGACSPSPLGWSTSDGLSAVIQAP